MLKTSTQKYKIIKVIVYKIEILNSQLSSPQTRAQVKVKYTNEVKKAKSLQNELLEDNLSAIKLLLNSDCVITIWLSLFVMMKRFRMKNL